MQRQLLNGKIHGVRVTQARIDYLGSITIDANLMKATDILEHEKVLIANLTNGARLESYAISGPAGSGVICLNGGAAKHGKEGDMLIVMSFVVLTDDELKKHKPKVVHVNEKNQIIP
jgi:aspartate 1-decarboxylase